MGFTWIGEYEEARRVDRELTPWPDSAEGRIDDALNSLRQSLEAYPEWAFETESIMGYVLHMAGRTSEALPHLEQFFKYVPRSRRDHWLFRLFPSDNGMLVRLAHERRAAGDEEGARMAIGIARDDQAALHAMGLELSWIYRADALIAAFDGNRDDAMAALATALQQGHRDPQLFDDPLFNDFRQDPQFLAMQEKLDAILETEHRKTLEMICLNNPVPDDWQPLPETCAGVRPQP